MMKENTYENPNKVYVRVQAVFSTGGKWPEPKGFWWKDRYIEIVKPSEGIRSASRKAGGIGIMYICEALGRPFVLYYENENNRWFIERKDSK